MVRAIQLLTADMMSTLAFVVLFITFHNVLLATSIAIAVGLGQIIRAKLSHWPVETLQWLSLGLVVALGGATLLTHNPRFIMVKPSFTYGAIGLVMLRPGWMNRYATPRLTQLAGDVFRLFGTIWAALMLATAGLNLLVAAYFSTRVWSWFLLVFPLASKVILVAAQYFTIRTVSCRRALTSQAAGIASG